MGPKVIVPLLAKRGGSSELELQAVEKVGGNEELGVGGCLLPYHSQELSRVRTGYCVDGRLHE